MVTLFDLPDIVLDKIFLYMSYDEIAKKRIVCKQFNKICGQLLNNGFFIAEKYHSRCMKAIKSELPRRESERRTHPLAKHCDILSGIETRMSMLSMTFMKYVSSGDCCFIPGKVIDEVFRLLKFLENEKQKQRIGSPPRALEILQELRDISSMAMEHFEETIAPLLKKKCEPECCSYLSEGSSRRLENFNRHFIIIRTHEKRNMDVLTKLNHKLRRSNRRIARQARILREQHVKLTEQDAQITEMKQHLEEWDHKLRELEAKVNRAKEDTTTLSEQSSSINMKEVCCSKRKLFTMSPTVCTYFEETQPMKKVKYLNTIEEKTQ